jgi:hypothetical protein
MNTGAPNWLGLLKWSLANTSPETNSNVEKMSEEDKLWLERVMKV